MRLVNRLCPPHTASPYLLQHRNNPVHWQPWDPLAFKLARQLDRPVFLSIGYSTCHWCHVMARESFESETVAKVLNDGFVAVKVDREERPDVDRQYMQYVQMLSGHGGWPLSVWMTPQGRPFYGGTYLRAEEFVTVCERIKRLWESNRKVLLESADRGWQLLNSASHGEHGRSAVDPKPLLRYYTDTFDEEFGGFGQTRNGPKFPMPVTLIFLTNYHQQYQDKRALQMATETATKMCRSALHDHVEGGFHRYTVDRQWSTPHFEKMLYDQGLLLEAFALLYAITSNEEILDGMRSIYRFVCERLTSSDGLFYCAEDADSLNASGEEEEGAFAVWTASELRILLPNDDFQLVCDTFGVSENGNAVNLGDKNCLNKLKGVDVVEGKYAEYTSRLSKAMKILLPARQKRPRPHRDEKTVTAWNGLMISGLAKASVFIAESLTLAEKAHKQLVSTDQLMRTNQQPACADDYAFMVKASLDLYQVTLDQEYLDAAVKLQTQFTELFALGDAYYYSQPDPDDMIVRTIDDYDGVEPSANSIAMHNLKVLDLLLDGSSGEYMAMYDKMEKRFSRQLADAPMSLPMMLTVSMTEHVVVSVPTGQGYLHLISKFPRVNLLFKRSTDTTWQVCHDRTCQLFTSLQDLEAYLGKL